ncbi:MAG TPA: hypothetical protein VEU95_00005 [Micropepsaceae bacterium]|nr:hypothetical protein [Micropepsaceae bacterium]
MADENVPPIPGTWTSEQMDHALEWLNNKFPKASVCHECDHDTIIAHFPVAPLRYVDGRGVLLGGGPLMPMLAVVCPNCGSTRFFNAMIMGLMKSDAPKVATTEPAKTEGGEDGKPV